MVLFDFKKSYLNIVNIVYFYDDAKMLKHELDVPQNVYISLITDM